MSLTCQLLGILTLCLQCWSYNLAGEKVTYPGSNEDFGDCVKSGCGECNGLLTVYTTASLVQEGTATIQLPQPYTWAQLYKGQLSMDDKTNIEIGAYSKFYISDPDSSIKMKESSTMNIQWWCSLEVGGGGSLQLQEKASLIMDAHSTATFLNTDFAMDASAQLHLEESAVLTLSGADATSFLGEGASLHLGPSSRLLIGGPTALDGGCRLTLGTSSQLSSSSASSTTLKDASTLSLGSQANIQMDGTLSLENAALVDVGDFGRLNVSGVLSVGSVLRLGPAASLMVASGSSFTLFGTENHLSLGEGARVAVTPGMSCFITQPIDLPPRSDVQLAPNSEHPAGLTCISKLQ